MGVVVPNLHAVPDTPSGPGNLRSLYISWGHQLRAEGRSPRTVLLYTLYVRQFVEYLEKEYPEAETPGRAHIFAWMAHSLDTRSKRTAQLRLQVLKRFYRWCIEEGEVLKSPAEGVRQPQDDSKLVPVLKPEDVHAVLAVCQGRSFSDRRDLALIMVLWTTGMRAGEVMNLTWDAVDLETQVFRVWSAKRKQWRLVPMHSMLVPALDRYMRSRAQHWASDYPTLWLGKSGGLTVRGLQRMVARRTQQAGVDHIHPHQFRHTFAHNWKVSGGSDSNLMALMGWSSYEMVLRYGRSAETSRALDAYHANSTALFGRLPKGKPTGEGRMG